ncbi:conjugal transfer protein TraF [Marinobacter sp.]|uniref:conjugal transfer protein TraF n=1 Tax=Marinobacter sp. TaxID=50741 RepID=UPI003564AFEA
MTGHRLTKLSVAIGLSIATSAALASPQSFMSARSFAMGGTGVAVATPSTAPMSNPAMLAADHHSWNDDFGLMLPSVNARAADEEETIDQVDDIQDVITDLESVASGFDPNNDDPQSIRDGASDLSNRLTEFDRDTMRVNAGLGLSLGVPGQSLSVGVFTNANLTATVRGDVSDQDINALDTIATAGTPQDVKTAIDQITNPDDSLNLSSQGQILASAVGEVGISFARAFELQDGSSFQLGLSPKYVELRTFQYTESVSGFEDDEFDSDQYQTDKSGFNLDVGAAYSFGEANQWNTGIVVKNLIPMELDSAASRPLLGEEVRTLKLDPMVTAGIAHKSDYHVVTAEIDLTKKEAFGFEDDTQWAALGAEFDAFRYAQLRIGVRHNLASNDDNDGIEEKTQFTAGLGLNIVGVRLDIGALYSDADAGAALELGTAF